MFLELNLLASSRPQAWSHSFVFGWYAGNESLWCIHKTQEMKISSVAARKAAGAARAAPAPPFESKDGDSAPLESQETATTRPTLLGSRHLAKIFCRKALSAEPDKPVDSESVSLQAGPNKALRGLVSRLGKPSVVADDAPLGKHANIEEDKHELGGHLNMEEDKHELGGHLNLDQLLASLRAFLEMDSVGRAADANIEEDKHELGGHLNLGQAVGLDEGAKAETMPVVLTTDPTDSMDWLGKGVMSAAAHTIRHHTTDVSVQVVGQVKVDVGAQLSLWRRASFPAYPEGAALAAPCLLLFCGC
jgi:hypothetical protein